MEERYEDTFHELTRWVAKRVKREDALEAIQELLTDLRLISQWEGEDADDRREAQKEALNVVRLAFRFHRQVSGPISSEDAGSEAREQDEVREASLPPEDPVTARAAAMCLYWAKIAEATSEVRKFRREVLGDTTFAPTDARRLIRSPAAAVLSPADFRAKGIPIVGHTAEFLPYEESEPSAHPYRTRATVKTTWSDGENVTKRSRQFTEVLAFWDGEQMVSVEAGPACVLRRLYEVAVHLARRYPWEAPTAAWLVLTGESPWVPPLMARMAHPGDVTNHGTITITAAHWVPEKVVSKFYSEIKAPLDSTPTTSRRRLALFRFVVERSSAINRWKPKGTPEPGKPIEIHELGLEPPPWRSLQAEWNNQYPPKHDWHYRDFRNLRRDFIQASKSLLGY